MRLAATVFALTAALLVASGCERMKPHRREPPRPDVAKRAVESLLPGLQFGANRELETFREVRAVDVAGAHFVPAENHWRIHYCAEYTNFASDAPQRRCDRNVIVYELDSKKWVGLATGAGTLYRWQVIDDATKKGDTEAASALALPEKGAEPGQPAP
ncbi:MAG TPA: hypothetical protein VFT98_05335 [Myxococcota bacterium]|nr:hypothetical protein [Myxococcota bacterium]